jgi:hypothetical protein
MTINEMNNLAGTDRPLHEWECEGRPAATLVAPVIGSNTLPPGRILGQSMMPANTIRNNDLDSFL